MLAQAFAFDDRTLQTSLLVFFLATVLIIGGAIISRYRNQMTEDDDTPEKLHATLKEAFEEGELDTAEFRRVQEVLARKLHDDLTGPGLPEELPK